MPFTVEDFLKVDNLERRYRERAHSFGRLLRRLHVLTPEARRIPETT